MKKNLNKIKQLLLATLLLGSSVVVKAQATFDQKVLASDREANDGLGRSVAVSGNYALVAATSQQYSTTTIPRTETPILGAGAVYLYKKNSTTNKWEQQQKIAAFDRAMYEGFGSSVAINDDYAFISSPGAPFVFPTAGPGAVYVYKRNTVTGVWEYQQKLLATDGISGDGFGSALSLSGDNIAVGAYQVNGSAGAVYIFERNTTTGFWAQKQKLVSTDAAAADRFGYSVSLNGTYLVAGAYYEDEDVAGINTLNMAGSIYVFKNTAGTWAQTQKLVTSDRGANHYFGYSVGISGNFIVAGAYQHSSAGASADGAVYVFERNTTTDVWSQKQILLGVNPSNANHFGWAVSIDGYYLAIGAGSTNTDADGLNSLGNSGAAYVFKNTAGTWGLLNKLVQPVRYATNYYGRAVSIKGGDILIGAYNHAYNELEDDYKANAGAAYSYKIPGVLPVGLVDYTAKLQNNGTSLLNWRTVSESNNNHFIVERSLDGITFFPLTSVTSKGNGAVYSYTDAKPLNGTNYYKLSQIDYDGTVALLGVKSVNVSFKNINYFTVSPNPVTGSVINVSLENFVGASYKIVLSNISGKKLIEKNISVIGSSLTIPLETSLNPGVYVLNIEGLGSQKVIIK